jgi:hypothetical protein
VTLFIVNIRHFKIHELGLRCCDPDRGRSGSAITAQSA